MHHCVAMGSKGVQNSNMTYSLPTIEDIVKARDSLRGTPIRKTPLQASETFSKLTGTKLFLKIESLQRTGSFKVRGAFVKLNTLSEEQCKYGVIAASAGNHAQGVAYAASKKNISCTIVMPYNASPAKVAATKSYRAKVVLRGSDYDECWAATQELALAEGRTIIHAFDDAQIISGQGTIGLELLEDLPNLDEVYLPIGGGGLAAGIAIAIKSKRPGVKIIGVESKAFPAMKESLDKGHLTTIKSGYTIADGISVKAPGKLTFEIASRYLNDIVLVDDSSIVKTIFLLMERAKLVVEPAGAASLAYLLSNGNCGKDKSIVSILTGGNIDMYLLGQIVAKGLMQTGRLSKIFLLLQDRPGEFKNVLDSISDLGINIVEVVHDRLSSDIPTGMAGVFLSLEMENQSYIYTLTSRLTEKGIIFKI